MSGDKKPILCYWDIRGLAQPIRFLLAYCGIEFTDKKLECGEAPDYNKDCWFNVKYSLGLDFPNLPYYIDGDVKITQSNAILRYIGRKHDLCGTTEKEKIKVDIMENQAMDFRNGFVRLCYAPKGPFEECKKTYLENDLVPHLKGFDKFLGDSSWFAGEKISVVDFPMYELLHEHRLMYGSKLLDNYANLAKFLDRFEALPQIKEYMSTTKYDKNMPCNNKMAYWRF
ncbi:glutathione S-transferase Mu 3-like [Tubulanus polymorphus]|uniref:glutathione S-transferase Mu 3-like n=1 Tax=Tubulanus polymorphus TaxID=672921 RepID=UPI003DA4F5B6